MTHCGVCHTDVSMAFDAWKKAKFPFVPGHEAVGVVAACGRAVKRVKLGDRVGIGYIKSSCGECLSCLRGCENVCEAGIVGTIEAGGKGGWSDYVRIKDKYLFILPDALDSLHAGPLLCAGVTVFSPLAQHVTPGCEVAVLGCGGLGHLAVQFADKMGACVTAVDVQADKADGCKQLVDSCKAMSADDFFGGVQKFNLVLNCATTAVDGAKMAAALLPGGVAVQLGIPGAGVNVELPLLETAFLELKFVGSNTGGRAITMQCLQFAAKKGIVPTVEQMPMQDVNKAIARINAGEAHYRIVLVNEE